VLLGFASAADLHALSFADILDEDRGKGYQRRFNSQHSQDFRRYIQRPDSTTIPLTFNLRPGADGAWTVVESGQSVILTVDRRFGRVLAQVDCQHRLGHLAELEIELPFMCFIGLSEREEMEIFNVINAKAKGLNSSLLDFHDSQLASDLGRDRPELYVSLYLKNEESSPWYQQLDLGGQSTSGIARRASLRTFQKAIKRFLARTKVLKDTPIEAVAREVRDFWSAVALVWNDAWRNPRKNLICKGVGVYALMELASDLHVESGPLATRDAAHFRAVLSDLAHLVDWSSTGRLRGLGGQSGVKAAIEMIRDAQRRARLKVVRSG
jgi:DNA sulfur modification protein DndB